MERYWQRSAEDEQQRQPLCARRAKERRAPIDGEIKECERRLRYLREAIRHVDATLSLFDPEGNPKAITAKRRYKRAKLFGAGNLGAQSLTRYDAADGP